MRIRNNLNPGDLGYIIQLHGTLYAQEYNLDHTFEGYVAAGMGEFAKSFEARKDFVAIAEHEDQILGSIFIMGLPDQTAQLRWFLLHPKARGQGLGKKLLAAAITFAVIEDSNQSVSGQLANSQQRLISTARLVSQSLKRTLAKCGVDQGQSRDTT